MEKIVLENNAQLQKGTYIITYKVSLFADLIAWLLEQIKPALNIVSNITEHKKVRIDKFETETIATQIYLKVYITILGDSPAVGIPAVLAVLGVLLIAVAIFLTFDKVEQIIETPAGKALSFGFLIFVIFGIYSFYILKKGN